MNRTEPMPETLNHLEWAAARWLRLTGHRLFNLYTDDQHGEAILTIENVRLTDMESSYLMRELRRKSVPAGLRLRLVFPDV